MNKLNLKVGELVKVQALYPVLAKVTSVDSHPFEYDMIEIEMQDSVCLPPPKYWVKEKYLTRAGEIPKT